MAPSSPLLAFDIGGTNLRGAACDPVTGRPLRIVTHPTPNFLDRPGWDAERLFGAAVEGMAAVGRALIGSVAPPAVAVGWPGPVTPEGTALRSPTILGPALDRPLPVGAAAARLWPGSRVALLNDLTCAGYAYAGTDYRDFCIVTVGSGIGNKVFVEGRPLVGPGGRGGEIGHVAAHLSRGCPPGVVEPGARLGEVSSGRGTLRLGRRLARARPAAFARSSLGPLGPDFGDRALAAAFRAGDAFARAAVTLAAAPLAHALAGVHASVGTERFVLTGGFAAALGEPYRRLLAAEARGSVWDVGQDWDAMIEIGDERDGLIGAGVHAARDLLGLATAAAA